MGHNSGDNIIKKDRNPKDCSLFLLKELQEQGRIDPTSLFEFVEQFANAGFGHAPLESGVSDLFDYCQNYYNQYIGNTGAGLSRSEAVSFLYSVFCLSFILYDSQKAEDMMKELVRFRPFIRIFSVMKEHDGITHTQLADNIGMTCEGLAGLMVLMREMFSMQGFYSTMFIGNETAYFLESRGKRLLEMAADCTGTSDEKGEKDGEQ